MSNRDWLLIFVYLYIIGVYCQQVYRSLKKIIMLQSYSSAKLMPFYEMEYSFFVYF